MLSKRWPQWPPFGGVYNSVIPHLTLADHQSNQVLLDNLAAIVRPSLPLLTSITEVWVIQEDDDDVWRRRATIPLCNPANAQQHAN